MALENLLDHPLVDDTHSVDTLVSNNTSIYSCSETQSETLTNPIHCSMSRMTQLTAKELK